MLTFVQQTDGGTPTVAAEPEGRTRKNLSRNRAAHGGETFAAAPKIIRTGFPILWLKMINF